MEFGTNISMETKQVLSQRQVESLSILSMAAAELHSFLQNEEIENPLMEYSMADSSANEGYIVRERDSFYGKRQTDGDGNMENFLSQMAEPEFSLEEFVMSQISAACMTETERRVAGYAVNCLDENGFLTVSGSEISEDLKVALPEVESALWKLKRLEPDGIFASGLEECLMIQAEGLEDEELLCQMIKNHLRDIADGRLSSITRAMGISSAQARKLIAVIRGLNPRPLNGFAGGRTEYTVPDIIFKYGDGQWVIELGDRFSGCVGINEFYVRMMNEVSDEELKEYFNEKLKRVRFVINAVEQRRTTLVKIAQYILKKQEKYFLNQSPLRPMTLEEVASEVSLSKSTVSRAVKDKYIASPKGCLPMRSLFSTGVGILDSTAESGGEVSRNEVKERLKELVDKEDKKRPLSDEKIVSLLREQGIDISRRTAAKYRTELGIAGAFARKEI